MLKTKSEELSPERRLAIAMLETYPDDIRQAVVRYSDRHFQRKMKEVMAQAMDPWTREICDIAAIDYSWFITRLKSMAVRAGYLGAL